MEIQNSKDWAKVYRACGFIEKGVCEYADERVYLSEETLIKSLHTIKGRPVIIDHMTGITPENMNEHAVGYVVDYEVQGACDCKFVIFDDEGKQVIADGYSVSCAYRPKSFGPGGTWHNVPYDREITDLEYTHLALVQNPRYEDAKVYENAKEEKGRWITVKGTHVFIKEGQSVEDAMKDTFKSSPTEKKEGGDLEGKYTKEDADFDVDQMKKDIKAAQDLGHESIEDVAEFLGLDEDEVRETLAGDDNQKRAQKAFELAVKAHRGEGLTEEERAFIDEPSPSERRGGSFDEEGFKKFVEANKKKEQYKVGDQVTFDTNWRGYKAKIGSGKIVGVEKEMASHGDPNPDYLYKVKTDKGKTVYIKKEAIEAASKSEKHNSTEKQLKEENMKVDEFFNKMGEMIEEKLNACKSKMNEGDEEEKEDDDDKFEMDGEVYSKKELVNAWKEKKNAEESKEKSDEESEEKSKEKSDEEEKQNSGDEFFNAMEKRMQQQANANDKIEIYSQAKGLEKGRSIYTK